MNKETLLEEMNKEIENVKVTPYVKMNEEKIEESKTIWTSEYNYDEEFIKERYQDYLDNYIPSKPKEYNDWYKDWEEDMYETAYYEQIEFKPEDYTNEELQDAYNDYVENYQDPGPLDREKWEFNFLEQDAQDQWEVMSENFAEQIFPMIEKQCHHNKLILLGTTGRWTGTAAGGDIIDAEEDAIRNVMSDYDEITVEEQDDKQLSIDFNHHDGTDTMYLYTYPEVLTELSKLMGYEDESEFEYEVEHNGIDAQDLEEHKEQLIKIVNTIE